VRESLVVASGNDYANHPKVILDVDERCLARRPEAVESSLRGEGGGVALTAQQIEHPSADGITAVGRIDMDVDRPTRGVARNLEGLPRRLGEPFEQCHSHRLGWAPIRAVLGFYESSALRRRVPQVEIDVEYWATRCIGLFADEEILAGIVVFGGVSPNEAVEVGVDAPSKWPVGAGFDTHRDEEIDVGVGERDAQFALAGLDVIWLCADHGGSQFGISLDHERVDVRPIHEQALSGHMVR